MGAQPGAWLARPLPLLRDDLTLMPGPAEADGSPTWTVYDPVRHRYFRFGRAGFEFLARWRAGSGSQVLEGITASTTLDTGPEELAQFIHFLRASNLLRGDDPASGQELVRQGHAAKQSWPVWLLHHYLFIRIPLVRPDRFLTATLPAARLLLNRRFISAVLLLGLVGVALAARQWDQFLHTAQNFFNAEGAIAFAVTLTAVKLCHELGHAYTAKHFGCRVPTMGVALLVLWPVLYTDVTDSWRLVSRRQRLLIDAAGVMTELMLALVATFLWSFLPDGPSRSAAFLVATTTWITTLAINASPFMRFDGYYMLSDWLAVSNLQDRAFAHARWRLRELLFGFDERAPEGFPPRQRGILLVYAWATWAYRLALFFGIAMLVYHFFIKVLGILLFAVEVGWFVARPIFGELKQWYKRRSKMRLNRNLLATLAGLGLVVWLVVTPWQSWVTLSAVLRASDYATLFAPVSARLVEVAAVSGQRVAAGQLIYRLESPELDFRLEKARLQRQAIMLLIERQASSAEALENLAVLQARLATTLSTIAGLEAQSRRLTLRAPVAGLLCHVPPELRPGLWLKPDQPLGEVIDPDGAVLRGYVMTAELNRLKVGATGRFIPEDPARPGLDAEVTGIERVNAAVLDTQMLGSTQHGPIAVQATAQGAMIPTAAITRVDLRLRQPTPAPAQVTPGVVQVEGEASSLVVRTWRATAAVLVRESGF